MPHEPVLQYSLTLPDTSQDWAAFTRLYQDEFPIWEQEPLDTMRERLDDGRYTLTVAKDAGDHPVGFYLLDQPTAPVYSILTFMAVAPEYRNRGLGRQICRHAFDHYSEQEGRWLLIEAEERQSFFYGRLGARCLDIEYHVPHFDDPGNTTPMYLMVLMRPFTPDQMKGDFLRRIIEHIFIEGYRVNSDDPCLIRQIASIPETVPTLVWPPA